MGELMQDQIAHKNKSPWMNPTQEADIIDKNDTILNVASYLNVKHELEGWM
jgi:hypothetical protein